MTDFGPAFYIARDKAYALFDADPEPLLAAIGNPGPGNATVIHARLVGYDEQVIDDVLMDSYHDRWLAPIMPTPRSMLAEVGEVVHALHIPRATYEPLAWFADVALAAEYARELPLWAIDDTRQQARVRFLLYRRTS